MGLALLVDFGWRKRLKSPCLERPKKIETKNALTKVFLSLGCFQPRRRWFVLRPHFLKKLSGKLGLQRTCHILSRNRTKISRDKFFFIARLFNYYIAGSTSGKMTRILCSDWLPERAGQDGPILPAQDCPLWSRAREKVGGADFKLRNFWTVLATKSL